MPVSARLILEIRDRATSLRRPTVALLTNSVSSLGNLVLAVAVARCSTIGELGRFGIAFSVYALVVGLSRTAVSDLALTRQGEGLGRIYLRRVNAISVLCALVVLLAAGLLHSPYLFFVGVALPGLSIYEHLKVTLLALGDAKRALVQESIWTVGTASAATAVLLADLGGLAIFAVWSLLGAVIGCVHAVQLGHQLLPGWQASGAEGRNMAGFGMQYMTGSGVAQLMPAVLAAFAGPAVVGALRAGGTLISPLTLILSTAKSFLVVRLTRIHVVPNARPSLLPAISTAVAMVALLIPVGLAVLALPDYVGRAILGSNWEFAEPLLPALVAELIFAAVVAVAGAGHRVFGAGTRGLMLETAMAPVRIWAIVWAGHRWSAMGAAVAMMAIAMAGVLLWWVSFARLVRNSRLPVSPQAGRHTPSD